MYGKIGLGVRAWVVGYRGDPSFEGKGVLSPLDFRRSAFPPPGETWMVTLECLGHFPGPRFLDGDVHDGKTGLAEHTDRPGTWWAVTTLSPFVVKFRCMANTSGSLRFLDGRTRDGSVGLAPMLAIPLTGERWEVAEDDDYSVTLRCLGNFDSAQFRFLDGRTLEKTVGLAPHADPPYAGTHWRARMHGKIVALEALGKGFGLPRFLDGRLVDGSVGLAPTPIEPEPFTVGMAPTPTQRFKGTWLLQEAGNTVTLKCLAELEGNSRYLAILPGARVGLVPHTEPPFTHWELTEVPNEHRDVEPGYKATLRGAVVGGLRPFLNGNLQGDAEKYKVALTAAATEWCVLPPSSFWEPYPLCYEPRAAHPTVAVVRTSRVGQLTGSKDPQWRPEDPQQWRLINGDTTEWGVPGTDLGAATEHREEDGGSRLFVFFGDVFRRGPDKLLPADGPPHDILTWLPGRPMWSSQRMPANLVASICTLY